MGYVTREVTRKEQVKVCDYCGDDAVWSSCAWCGKDFCEKHGMVISGRSVQVGYHFFPGYMYLAICLEGNHISDPPSSWDEIRDILSHLKYQEVKAV